MKLSDLQFGDQILQLLCRVEGDSQRRDLRLKGLCEILSKYKFEVDISADTDGKKLYGVLINELRGIRKDREELVEIVVKYLVEANQPLVDTLAEFLKRKISGT